MDRTGANVTLITLLEKLAAVNDRGITLIHSQEKEGFLSYADLYSNALQVLGHLQAQGVLPGNEVVLMLEDNRQFLLFFWACLLGKIIPVPLPAGNQDDHKYKLVSVWSTLHNPYLVCEQVYYNRLSSSLSAQQPAALEAIGLRYLPAATLLTAAAPGQTAPVQATETAYIQFSSGSTGTPKGVTLTHQNLLTNIQDIVSRSQTTAADKSLSWMPLSHDMGLICFHLSCLLAGIDQYIMDTALFIRNPVLWIEKASQHRISQLYSPNFGYHYFLSALEGKAAGAWDLSTIRIIYNGAEPISHKLCRQFTEKLAPCGLRSYAIFAGYGLAEASVAVALPDVNDALRVHFLDRDHCNIGNRIKLAEPRNGIVFVENGYPLEHCAVRICGNEDEVFEERIIGHIQIKGGNVTAGYYNNTAATCELLTPDGWLRTGDVGFLYKGRITITGRHKNIIIINGQNYYPQDIEAMVSRALPAFDLGKVVVCGVRDEKKGNEELLVFLLYKGDVAGFAPLAGRVKEAVLETTGLTVQAVIPVRKIPKTTSGKVQHFKLATLYRQSAFQDITSKLDELVAAEEADQLPDHLSIPEKLARIWKDLLGMKPLSPEQEFFTAGLNSLVATRFISYIRRLLQADVSISDLFRHPSLDRLAACVAAKGTVKEGAVSMLEEQDHYSCTDIQQRFWLLQQMDVQSTAYNLHSGFVINGALDLTALNNAITTLLLKYDILRTTFVNLDGNLRQRVSRHPDAAVVLQSKDLREQQASPEEIALWETQQPFNLEQGPLLRFTCYQLADTQYLLFFAIHHIIADGWSVNVMMDLIKKLYRQHQQLRGAGLQYHDYAAYNAARNSAPLQQAFWKETLAGYSKGVELPFTKPRSAVQTFAGHAIKQALPPTLHAAIKKYCLENGCTEFMLVTAALRALLFRYTQQADIVIGTDTAGRTHPDLELQLGCFLNTLPLRLPVQANESFKGLLRREKQGILQALQHQAYSFDKMITDVQPEREFSRTPVFNVLLLFQNLEGSTSLTGLHEQLTVQPISMPVTTSMVDLEVEFTYEGPELFFQLRYNTDLFDDAPVERMAGHFIRLLENALSAPDTPVAAIDILSQTEKEQVHNMGRGSVRDLQHPHVLQAFEQWAAVSPHATALVFEGQPLSYEEVNLQANRLAHYLITEKGVQPGRRLGLMMERSANMIITLLAILKTGAAYVPVDAAYPPERVLFITAEAGLQWLLTDEDCLPQTAQVNNRLQVTAVLHNGTAAVNPGIVIKGDEVAYILYTSGSTGQPKGVMIRHESLVNYIQTFMQYFNVTPADRVIQQSALVFDISVEEIFAAFSSGAALVVVKDGGRNVAALLQTIEKEQATILSTTPLVIKEINAQASRVNNLRLLISGGDVLKPAYIDQLPDSVAIYNTYGPTETTVCVSYNKITTPETVSLIGRPLPEHHIYILDEAFQPVPVGIAGQLYVAGKGLARGYVNPALDQEAFIHHPAIPGERLYRTGDMGLWTENGSIRFLGRKDAQLKWNGYRIEPGEVEKKILLYKDIADVVVTISGIAERRRLTAYLVAPASMDTAALKLFLLEHLPAYMIPVAYVIMEQLPVNVNGKVDMKVLPEPADLTTLEMVLPAGSTEAALLEIWQQVLKQPHISVLASFFELGGNSLKATQVVTRIQDLFGVSISIREVLTHPTIRSMAACIKTAGAENRPDLLPLGKADHYPLSLSQRRLWVLQRLEVLPLAYNLCWSFIITGETAAVHFENALTELVQRHESLRSTFTSIQGTPFVVIRDHIPLPLSRKDLRDEKDALAWKALALADSRTPFDLEKGPLFRVQLLQLQENVYRVIFTIHHIITDGWSMEVLWKELGMIEALPPLQVQYKDYAAWQQQLLASENMQPHRRYWLSRFQGQLPALTFPFIKHTPEAGFEGKKLQFPLSARWQQQLMQLSKGNDVTLFTVLLAVWKLLLFRLTGQQQMIIATPTAGRHHTALENQVGYYLNILPLYTAFNAELSFNVLLTAVKQTVEEAFAHQEFPVEELIAHLDMGRDINRNPLFDVMLVLQNFEHLRAAGPVALQQIEEIDNGTSVGSLLIEFIELEQQWFLRLRYDTRIFSEAQVSRLAACFEYLCEQVAADPDLPLHRYSLLTAAEEQRLLHTFNTPQTITYPANTVMPLLEQAAAQFASQAALYEKGTILTYQQLQEKAARLSAQLCELQAGGPGKRVGILLERSANLIISILAVLRTGAAYVPLDAEYPAERIRFMVTHAGIDLVITTAAGLQQVQLTETPVLDLSSFQWSAPVMAAPAYAVQPDDLAYIMYTSGSTGRPKGIQVSHAALADYVQTFIRYFSLNSNDRVIQQSSPAFDVSIEEIFPALCSGATVLVLPEGGRDIDRLLQLMRQEQATLLSTTPPVIAALDKHATDLGALRILISGGDRLTGAHIQQLTGKVAIYNTYGPTETTVCATYHPVKAADDAACIGKPIPNREVYLLNEQQELVLPGIAGEIHIAGAGLANGYLHLEAETRERFIPHPFKPGSRLYKTGDLGVWDEEGNIYFTGRKDSQVKINGYRVEPAEIEKVLLTHPAIQDALVMAAAGNTTLRAYIITENFEAAAIKSWLSGKLPYYMIPAEFIQLEAFPVTTNGKTDLTALQALTAAETAAALNTLWEQRLSALWSTVLETAVVNRTDNFFALGGNSIKATQLVSRLQEQWQVQLPLRDVFIHPLLHEMAGLLSAAAVSYKIEQAPAQANYQVSHAQKRIWLLTQLGYDEGAYHIYAGTRLQGKLQPHLLEQCFNALVARHESLRTTFAMVEGELRQVIHVADDLSCKIIYTDLRQQEQQEQRIHNIIQTLQHSHFDLAQGPLFNVQLLQLQDEAWILLLAVHHIVSDGWSVNILFRELETLYAAACKEDVLPPLHLQYKDYAHFMNSPAVDENLALHRQYWQQQFAVPAPLLELPLDFPRPRIRSSRGSAVLMELDAVLVSRLHELSAGSGATLFMLLLAALKALLYRYSGQEDIVTGTPVSGREAGGLENQVGCYVNTLPLRTIFSGNDSFEKLLQRVKENVLEAFAHQLYPFDEMVKALQQERDLSHSPLFDVMLAMQQDARTQHTIDSSAALQTAPYWLETVSSKFDLTLYVYETGAQLQLVLEYSTDLFEQPAIARLLEHYRNILEHVTVAPHTQLNRLPLMSAAAQQQLLQQYSLPVMPLQEPPRFVTDLLEAAAHGHPQHTAVVCGTAIMPYHELLQQAQRIAGYLHTVAGVRPNDRVGLMVDRSEKMVAALLGILFSGAAYVPVDPAYPPNRIAHIISDSGLTAAITEEQYVHHFTPPVHCITTPQLLAAEQPVVWPLPLTRSIHDQAYVIYTSVSTGQPKGIPITHYNLWSLISWAQREFAADQADIVYAVTSYCFDLSVFELLYPLGAGKSVRVLQSGLHIADHLEADRNILINTVPSVMDQLLKNGMLTDNVKSINLAGEPLYPGLAEQITQTNIRLRNLYGPSEDTTYSTCYVFKPQDATVTIGRPIDGKRIYIVDAHMNLLPPGVKGEIAIAGPGVAGSYLNQPALTAQKFIPDPFYEGATLYLTGDIGKWLPDGNLEFLGRKDQQLKIRGYRIEPGEIELALLQVPGVQGALVTGIYKNAGDQYLAAYYTAPTVINPQLIQERLQQQLPAYMVPAQVHWLKEFPLTPNGKIDRNLLLQTTTATAHNTFVAAVTPVEQALSAIWAQVLDQERIGVKDNFFTAGGHSLNAMQVVHSIIRHFGVQLVLRDLFMNPTIEQLAALITQSSPAAENIPVLEEQVHYVPSHMQRRLWILDRLEKNSAAYNMSSVYQLSGKLDQARLAKAYRSLIARHESLRTTFIMVNGEVRQKINAELPQAELIQQVDMRGREALAPEAAGAYMQYAFDLENGPLLQLTLLRYADEDYFFIVCMHHTISDGISMNVIMQEILPAYGQLTGTLPPLKIQYRDFAAWQQQLFATGWGEKMQAYWLQQLGGPIPVLDLPGARLRPAVKTYQGSEAGIWLGDDTAAALSQLAAGNQATLFMLLIGAFKTLCYRYTGQEDILIGTPASGRWHPDMEDQVGFYVNTLVLRTTLNGKMSFIQLLGRVKEMLLNALEHQYYPFDKLLEELQLKRDISRSPLFDIMAVFRDSRNEATAGTLENLHWKEVTVPATQSKYDLTITFTQQKNGLAINVVYNTDLYDSSWITRMLEHYRQLLNVIVQQPALTLNAFTYLSPAEQATLAAFNNTAAPRPPGETLVSLFEQQVQATPDNPALLFEEKVLSYRQLNKQANRLAALLRNMYQVQPNERVGIMMDRSEKLLTGILGILKSGAAYVPIDPAYPPERKIYIAENSRLKVLITEQAYIDTAGACTYLVPDEAQLSTLPSQNLPAVNTPDSLAYVIYTSGTTGRPKGVMVEHHSVVNLSAWLHTVIYKQHARPLKVMVNASVSFDSSVKQLFPPLLAGAALMLIPETTHKDPKALVTTLLQHRIDVWDVTPGYLNYILKHIQPDKHFPAYTLAGGEALSPVLVTRYHALLNGRSTLMNVYGVTEATVDSTWCITNEDAAAYCNIGRPLPNTAIYILDGHRQQVPIGFPGEICIAGAGVSRGYLYDEEQTAKKFIRNPYGEGRLYCTGDLGKWHADGTIEFLGRADRQVKVNGYRIELAEIEQVILQHQGIQQVYVTVIQDSQAELQIAAYFVSDGVIAPADLRSHLQQKLPVYMLPAWLIPLQQLPLNEHGKVNKAALPDPRSALPRNTNSPVEPPAGEAARTLLTLWEAVLESSHIGLHDNFFDLGGNSLKVIRLYNAIQEIFPDQLEIHQLFSHPTISKQSALLSPASLKSSSSASKDINLIEL